jgi:hypothetical protein
MVKEKTQSIQFNDKYCAGCISTHLYLIGKNHGTR